MKLDNIDTIQKLITNLKTQVSKLNHIQHATNIHVSFNGPSQTQIHMNFASSTTMIDADTNAGDYNWDEAYDFMEAQLQKKITYLRDRLKTYGVEIDG